jgi:hypothetical protein
LYGSCRVDGQELRGAALAAVDIYYTKTSMARIDASSTGEIFGLATRTVQVYFEQAITR